MQQNPISSEINELLERKRKIDLYKYPVSKKTSIISFINQKGGVGKTTSCVNIAAALAKNNQKVLVIDLDPQSNASTALGVEHFDHTRSSYDLLTSNLDIEQIIQSNPEFEQLKVIPANINLAGIEFELMSAPEREKKLTKILSEKIPPNYFDYILIDCPPSLGILSLNALTASDFVLIPIQGEYYALEGLAQLIKTINLVKQNSNPNLHDPFLLLTMFNPRTNLALEVENEVSSHFGKNLLTAKIPRSVRLSEAPGFNQTILSYDKFSPGSISYQEASFELVNKIQKINH